MATPRAHAARTAETITKYHWLREGGAARRFCVVRARIAGEEAPTGLPAPGTTELIWTVGAGRRSKPSAVLSPTFGDRAPGRGPRPCGPPAPPGVIPWLLPGFLPELL